MVIHNHCQPLKVKFNIFLLYIGTTCNSEKQLFDYVVRSN